MRLLIFTQRVDREDENLGSFHRWIEEFAKHFDSVSVIAGRVGVYQLPLNVRVFSFRTHPEAGLWSRLWHFVRLSASLIPQADAIFYHMIPEFIVATTPWLLFSKARIGLWYTHKSVTWKLHLAECLVNTIFTPVPASFGISSKKVLVTGHAIDTTVFSLGPVRQGGRRLVTVGRITPVKRIEVMLEALWMLHDPMWHLDIIGAPFIPSDITYEQELRDKIARWGLESQVAFLGKRSFMQIPELLREYDIFLSFTDTGSLDKAVLEAMSSGLKVLTVNQAFRGAIPDPYLVSYQPQAIVDAIYHIENKPYPVETLRDYVLHHHALTNTIATIVKSLKNQTEHA